MIDKKWHLTSIGLLVSGLFAFALKNQSAIETHEGYQVLNTWELPGKLDEVSGISWIDTDKMACVEDENGIIFIYDLKTRRIENEIVFADGGDYEGIALKGANAYIMRSDGLLYEVENYNTEEMKVKTYKTGFSTKNNMETLSYDQKRGVLLTAPKDRDSNSDRYKGLYSISIDYKKVSDVPLFRIDMKEEAFKGFRKKKLYKTFNPSDLEIHPKTGEIYVLEGKHPKLLIFSGEGKLKKVYRLGKSVFPQPEGITFSPDGTLYISNEANGGSATILEVQLN